MDNNKQRKSYKNSKIMEKALLVHMPEKLFNMVAQESDSESITKSFIVREALELYFSLKGCSEVK